MTFLKSARVAGLSLIELMVALAIGTVLLLGLVQVFSASRTAYQVSEGISRVQENGRFAMDYLQRDIRMAGHYGCINDQAHLQKPGALVSHFPTGGALDFRISVQGYEANGTAPGDTVNLAAPAAGWTPALPPYITDLRPAPLPGSDIIVLRYLRGVGAPVTGIVPGASTTIAVPAAQWNLLTEDGVGAPVLFGLADCSFVDIFGASATNPGTGAVTTAGNIDRYTAHPAGQTALYRAEAAAYYVGTGAGGGRALFRARWNNAGIAATEELVEGVESLQLIYGLDQAPVDNLSGNIAAQLTANALGNAASVGTAENDWRRVGQIQIGLVMGSPDRAAAPQKSGGVALQALGARFTPANDGAYRTSYETTVALRNRLYGN